jgi:hypothetical protein
MVVALEEREKVLEGHGDGPPWLAEIDEINDRLEAIENMLGVAALLVSDTIVGGRLTDKGLKEIIYPLMEPSEHEFSPAFVEAERDLRTYATKLRRQASKIDSNTAEYRTAVIVAAMATS